MPLPTIADTVRVSVEGTMPNGRHWANILHYRKTSITPYATAIGVADPLIYQLWATSQIGGAKLQQFMANTWSLARIRHTPLDGTSATTVISHPLTGTSASVALPAQVALVGTLYTTQRGRQHRGRIYLGGFAEDSVGANGVLLGSYLTLIQAQFSQWLLLWMGTTVFPVVASYGHGSLHGVKTTWAPYATDVASILVNNVFDTQKRRNRP